MALVGKSAVVFGGGRGVGRACATLLAARGADVAIVYHNNHVEAEKTADAVRKAGRRVLTIACDVADAAQVEGAYQRIEAEFGAFQMLVSTVGVAAPFKTVRAMTPVEWAGYVAVDLNGTFNILHYGLGPLKDAGGGGIVVISSIAAQMVQARNPHGAAAKAGVEALVRVLAREEARNRIRANAVAIGITDTDMVRPVFESWGEETVKRVIAGIPLGRIGTPEDVANSVAFLLSDEGAYITGKVMQVDGGQFIGG